MGCTSCKGKKVATPQPFDSTLKNNISNYIIKTIIFLFMMVGLPLIMLYIIWVLFSNIVLSKDIDIIPLLRNLLIKLNKKIEVEEDEVYLNEEYEIINLETIN